MTDPEPFVQGPLPPGRRSHDDATETPDTSSDLELEMLKVRIKKLIYVR